MTAEKILEIARSQLGIKENPPNSNQVKFNTAYYGQEVSGSAYPWCCAFVWWVFREAGASELFYGGKKTASCSTLLGFHKAQAVRENYLPGDIIFFNFDGKKNTQHVGICEDWDGRCMVKGKNGKLIRCPECNRCEDCERSSEVCRERNKTASLSFLVDEGAEPATEGAFEDGIIYETILEDLIAMLNEVKPKYGRIFRLLYDGATQQEMADELGIKQRTVSDDIKKIRSLVQPLVKGIFNK